MKMGCLCSKESLEINGKEYHVKEKLGEGGFSMVYLAQETNSRRFYAIKKIVCYSTDDEKHAFNEVDIHNKVKHDNLIKLIDYCSIPVSGQSKSHFLLVLPYFERGTLLQELDRRGQRSFGHHFRPIEIYEMFLKICEGVRVFHDNGPLAHRDLKTANIALDINGSPIIMDFGSATTARAMITSSSEAQALQDLAAERCSMPYRAPELFNVSVDSVIDERTDIWSLGCILYALCFFKSPFDAVYERGDSVALAVLSGNTSFSGQIYDQEMENLIRFMLQVDPEERPFISSVIERTCIALDNARKDQVAV